MSRVLTKKEARAFLISTLGLASFRDEEDVPEQIRGMFNQLGCVQLDPLDPFGQNADLVTFARVRDADKGDVYRALLPRGEDTNVSNVAFEHFYKERCLVPASAFPYYRDEARARGSLRLWRYHAQCPKETPGELLAYVRALGTCFHHDELDLGRITHRTRKPKDWKPSPKTTRLAVEVLADRGDLVVSSRTARAKRFDLPSRALGHHATAKAAMSFARFSLLARVKSCGLMSRNAGPHWTLLRDVRATLPDQLIEEGLIEEITIAGSPARYLVERGALDRPQEDPDGEMRVLGPLDPMIWDRKLVSHAFAFDYVWEVYKPKAKRAYGWYVVPLLHRDRLVGRMEGHVNREESTLEITNVWKEPGRAFSMRAFDRALDRLATANGCAYFERPIEVGRAAKNTTV